jgi:hypothetical protein
MVRHIMIKQQTGRFATSRRANVVADACRNAQTAIIGEALAASASIKQPSAPRFIRLSVQGSATSGCTSQPSAAIKSP